MHLSRLRPIALATLVLAGLLVQPAAAADNEASWSVETAANHYGTDRPNFGYTLNPGDRRVDGIVVANHGTTPLRLALYAADAFTNRAGRLDLLTRDAGSTGVGAWVHPGRDAVTVPAGGSVAVPFAITVPDRAAPGDHMGGIVTSLRQGGGKVERRIGTRIRLRVSGPYEPSLSVENLHVGFAGRSNPIGKGKATVTYAIHNTGNAILGALQKVGVSGPFGRWAVDAGSVADSPPLLPGETWKMSVPLREVAPAGRLTATVTLVPLLTDPAGSTAPLAATKTSEHAWTIPWALLLLTLIVLCGLVVAALAFRARRRERAPHEPSPQASVGQAPR